MSDIRYAVHACRCVSLHSAGQASWNVDGTPHVDDFSTGTCNNLYPKLDDCTGEQTDEDVNSDAQVNSYH